MVFVTRNKFLYCIPLIIGLITLNMLLVFIYQSRYNRYYTHSIANETKYNEIYLNISEFNDHLPALHLKKFANLNMHQKGQTYYFRIDHIERSVVFENPRKKSGLGNYLSTYWLARAFAYWMEYEFIGVQYFKSNEIFAHYLPTNYRMEVKKRIIEFGNSSTVVFFSDIRGPCAYGHNCPLLFMFYNRYFQPLINIEIIRALDDYYRYHESLIMANVESNSSVIEMTDSDIVIHIRCGDIFAIPNKYYGFLTRKYYEYAINNATQNALNVHWKRDHIHNGTNVWILSQLSKESLRIRYMRSHPSLENACEILILEMVENTFKEIFAPATIQVLYNSDANADFRRMVNAPLLICSVSTFCLHAAIANINGLAIIPRRGPWYDLMSVVPEVMPPNHIIVDARENGWFCLSVNDSCMHRSRILNKSAHELAHFLNTH